MTHRSIKLGASRIPGIYKKVAMRANRVFNKVGFGNLVYECDDTCEILYEDSYPGSVWIRPVVQAFYDQIRYGDRSIKDTEHELIEEIRSDDEGNQGE